MSISGITTTADNGIERITTGQQITGTATADGETLVLDGSSSILETGTSTGSITLTNCCVVIDSDTGTGNDAAAILNYGGRTVTGTTFEVIDSVIIINALSSRHNIQLTDLNNVLIVEQDATAEMFVYTRGNGDIIDVTFRDINVWEIYGPPANLDNVLVDGLDYAYLNWEAGRLDFFNFRVANIGAAHAWMGTSNSGNNFSYHWNNDSSFNNQLMYLTDTNNRYYEGYTASWKFSDQLTSNAVEDVLVILKDNLSGSMTTLGTYTTNSSGYLVGTWDSQNRSTGSSQERPILFMMTLYTSAVDESSPGAYDYPTSVIGGDAGNRSYNYELTTITNQVEVRSYLHLAPSGHLEGNNYIPSEEIGKRASDGTVNQYQSFVLQPDTGLTETNKSTVLAYAGIDDMSKLYDRCKAEWRDNNGYPLPLLDGVKINIGATNLVLDGDDASSYVYTSGTDTITIGTESSVNIILIGSEETATTTGEDDEITVNFPAESASGHFALLIIGHAQSDENTWNTPSGWSIVTGLTEVQTGGSPASVPGVSVFYRVLTGSEGSSVTVTNAGTNTSGIVAQMLVYSGVDTTSPFDTTSVTASGASGDPDPGSITPTNNGSMIVAIGFMDDGNQTTPTQPSGYTAIEDTATTYGAGTGE